MKPQPVPLPASVGTVLALGYMVLSYAHQRTREGACTDPRTESSGTILRTLLHIAIPITLTSSMVGIVTVIDSALVQGQLQKALVSTPDSWTLYQHFIDFSSLNDALSAGSSEAASLAEDISRSLYGNYSGAITLYNLPSSLMVAITASVIPAISAALTRRDRKASRRIAAASLRMCALVAFPAGIGLFVLGEPIIQLIFPKLDPQIAGALLSSLGIASIFVCLMMVCNSVLQAYGFINLPVVIMLIGGAIKIVVNYNLVALPDGASMVRLWATFCASAWCVCWIWSWFHGSFPGSRACSCSVGKPLAAALAMGAAAGATYGLAARFISSNTLCTLAAIAVAGVVYLVLIVVLRAITGDELALISPRGPKSPGCFISPDLSGGFCFFCISLCSDDILFPENILQRTDFCGRLDKQRFYSVKDLVVAAHLFVLRAAVPGTVNRLTRVCAAIFWRNPMKWWRPSTRATPSI